MIDFAYPCRMISMVAEVLGPGRSIPDGRARAFIAQYAGRMRIVPGHEGSARWPAIGSLAVCFREAGSFGRQFVDIGGLANLVTITGQGGVGQVIGDDEENVGFFRPSACPKPY